MVQEQGNWFMRNMVGNWEIAPIYTYESPEYFTVQSGIDSNLNGDAWPDRVHGESAGAAHTGSAVTAIDRRGATVALGNPSTVAYVANNPNARYIQAGYGVIAECGPEYRTDAADQQLRHHGDEALQPDGAVPDRVRGADLQSVQPPAIRSGVRERHPADHEQDQLNQ